GLVPFLSVLSAAAEVRDRVDPAPLEPRKERRYEHGRIRDEEAAISLEESARGAVAPLVLPVHDEHRDARPILRWKEHLADRGGRGVRRNLHLEIEGRGTGRDRGPVDRRRRRV